MKSLSTTIIFALVLFAFCGAGMMCIEQIMHYGALAGSIPVQLFVASMLLCLVVLCTLPNDRTDPVQSHPLRVFERMPEMATWPPLKLAFSDGILNTKVF